MMKKKSKKSGCLTVLLVLLVIGILGSCIGGNDDSKSEDTNVKAESANESVIKEDTQKEEKEKKEKEEEKITDWSRCYPDDNDHVTMYVVITQNAVDQYISGVKWPWGYDSYTFADYDDTGSGTIFCSMNSVEIKNVVEKQTIFVIFTIDPDGEHYRVNSVQVGDSIYQDDGKLESLYNTLLGTEE